MGLCVCASVPLYGGRVRKTRLASRRRTAPTADLYLLCLCVCASVRLCIPMSVCPSVHLSLCPSVSLSLCPSVRLSLCPSVPLCICPSASVHLSLCTSVPLSVCPSVPLCVCPSVHLCVSVILALVVVHLDNFGANRTVDAIMRHRRQNTWHTHIGLGYNGCSHLDQMRLLAP